MRRPEQLERRAADMTDDLRRFIYPRKDQASCNT